MEFVRGNLALRDHSENSEDVHLFEQVSGGLRYDGQMVCAGYYERDDVPDRNGDLRRAIVFELVALDDERPAAGPEAGAAPAPDSRWTMPLDELRGRASRTVGKQPNASEAKRRTYERSEDLRVYVRRRADGRCEGCGSPAPFVTPRGTSLPRAAPHEAPLGRRA